MTLAQVIHALCAGNGSDDQRQIEAEAFGRQCEVLDRICKRNRWRPERLMELPVSEVAWQVQAETGGKSPQIESLVGILVRFAKQGI
ncbi:MAG: hypothetical protein ABSF29_04465 [Tepidisphaeraceae bacterium]|jgi:hypothetical protein